VSRWPGRSGISSIGFLVLCSDGELAQWLGDAAGTTDARAEAGPWRQVSVFQSNKQGLFDEIRELSRAAQQLGPAELSGCLPPMAVRAAHVALLDLGEDLGPRLAARKARDLTALGGWIPVVKVEEHRIAQATVDARVLQKVGE
jgi:hypothetical protein